MNKKIKAKVLEYTTFYHGFYCGKAKLEILEGEDKGETVTMQVIDYYKVGDIIDIREATI
jgi:ribosomal protein S28E/S33